jgi:hypothetical protein
MMRGEMLLAAFLFAFVLPSPCSNVPLHHARNGYDIVVGWPMMEVDSMGGNIRTTQEQFREN